jgi:AcrR family transcriptional regulator
MQRTIRNSDTAVNHPKLKAGSELREKVLKSAGRLFSEGGYKHVSMRRIAEEVGCSQMAMYRHFPDKDALMQQLCVDLYEQFTIRMHKQFALLEDPRERLWKAMQQFLTLSIKNPHHYRLVFLYSNTDEQGLALRSTVANSALAYFRGNLSQALPSGTSEVVVDERLHQLLACLHGMSVLLITHPRVYRINREVALRELKYVLDLLLTTV